MASFDASDLPRLHQMVATPSSPVALKLVVFVLILAVALGFLFSWNSQCKANLFREFYGLTVNHFDFAAFLNVPGTPPPPFYEAVLSTGVMQIQSFFMYSCRGCGKTTIKSWRVQQIPEKTFYFEINTTFVQNGLDYFALQCPNRFSHECISEHWTDNDFAELLLSGLITQFLSEYHRHRLDPMKAKDLLKLTLRTDIVEAAVYFTNSMFIAEVENLINDLFGKELELPGIFTPEKRILREREIKIQDEDKLQQRYVDKPGFTQIQRISTQAKVVNPNRFQHNRLFFGFHDALQLPMPQTRTRAMNLLRSFSQFIKAAYGLSLVVSLDGLDENTHFFNGHQAREEALKKFILSSISYEFVSLLMANELTVFFFFPTIDSMTLEEFISLNFRQDKISSLNVKWNSQQLANYAEFYFDDMRSSSHWWSKCRSLPKFSEFVPLAEVRDTWDQIQNPRQLNAVVTQLIIILQEKAPILPTNEKFLATKEDFLFAFKAARASFLKSG